MTMERKDLALTTAGILETVGLVMREQLDERDGRLLESVNLVGEAVDAIAAEQARVLSEAVATVNARLDTLENATTGAELNALAETVRGLSETLAGLSGSLRVEMTALVTDLAAAAVAQVTDAGLRATAEVQARALDVSTRALEASERARTVKDGEAGPPGPPGERGPAGTLAGVTEYMPGAIYQRHACVWLAPNHPDGWAMAECIAEEGQTYDIPADGSPDWKVRLFHGRPGEGLQFMGLFDPEAKYSPGDVVMSETGGAFVRNGFEDDPELPGPGWDLMVKAGRTGGRGPKGEDGKRGAPGKDGVGIADIALEADHLQITLTDGSVRVLPFGGAA